MSCGEYNNEPSVFRNGRQVDRCVNGCWPSNLHMRTVRRHSSRLQLFSRWRNLPVVLHRANVSPEQIKYLQVRLHLP